VIGDQAQAGGESGCRERRSSTYGGGYTVEINLTMGLVPELTAYTEKPAPDVA